MNYDILHQAQILVLAKRDGVWISPEDQAIIDQAFDEWGPEGVYMDGEL